VNPMNEWISVKERKPEPFVPVLTYCEEQRYNGEIEPEIEDMYYDPEYPHAFCRWNGILKKFHVTHWMPLPAPPKED